jgi:hypothetical protein
MFTSFYGVKENKFRKAACMIITEWLAILVPIVVLLEEAMDHRVFLHYESRSPISRCSYWSLGIQKTLELWHYSVKLFVSLPLTRYKILTTICWVEPWLFNTFCVRHFSLRQ